MFKLIVNGKNGHEESEFETLEKAQAHFNFYKSKGYWGKEEHVIHYNEIPAVYKTVVHPAESALKDENDIEVVPAKEEWSEEILVSEAIPPRDEVVPCEYTWEIKDRTSEVNAERVKKETKKADRDSRVDQFKKIDWNAVTTIAHLKAIVKSLVKEAIKDEE